MIIVDGQVRVELRDDTGVFSISSDSDDDYDYADDNSIVTSCYHLVISLLSLFNSFTPSLCALELFN